MSEDQETLILSVWPRLPRMVTRFNCFARHIDDPLGVASLGLVKAARSYDSNKMCSFTNWAWRKVRSELRDEYFRVSNRKMERLGNAEEDVFTPETKDMVDIRDHANYVCSQYPDEAKIVMNGWETPGYKKSVMMMRYYLNERGYYQRKTCVSGRLKKAGRLV